VAAVTSTDRVAVVTKVTPKASAKIRRATPVTFVTKAERMRIPAREFLILYFGRDYLAGGGPVT
jgi:hypothetical protein